MGTAKQQLLYKSKSLLENAVSTALAANAGIVVVVLGYEADKITPLIKSCNISITINGNWRAGMGSSISKGMLHLLNMQPAVDDAIIMLCDQPLVTADVLHKLIETRASVGCGIVACTYGGTVGVPALFDKVYFDKLVSLEGESGAKKILHQFADDVASINFPGGAIDIDTPEDFERLNTPGNF